MPDEAPADPGSAGRDPWASPRSAVEAALASALSAAGLEADRAWLANQLEATAQPPADLAVALHRLARPSGQDPTALAAQIVARLGPIPEIVQVEARAGYVNFRVGPTRLARRTLELVFALGPKYGHGAPVEGAVSVEHTSANTTGPFHIGRVRNAVIGDTLVRVLRASGRPVTSQYYVDDVGRQAAVITWAWNLPEDRRPQPFAADFVAAPNAPGLKEDHRLGRPYPAASAYLKQHPETMAEVQAIYAELEQGREPPGHHDLADRILRGMLDSLGRLDIRFDEFVWESSLIRDGSVEAVLQRLANAPHAVREENGALAIDARDRGLPKESARIIVRRADGTSLYVTRDVAFHLQKFRRFTRVLDVLGADHLLHARTLEALLDEVGESRRPEFVLYAYITAPGGGKMSTREGTAVYLDGLLDEAVARARAEILRRRQDLPAEEVDRIAECLGTGAIRYSILRVAAEKTVQFRWEDALAFEGRSGPFLQYSYARATTLLRKADGELGPFSFDPEELGTEWEGALLRTIARLPGTVAYAARSGHVHALATFAHDLAEQFNRFYNEVPVLRAERERTSRLALVAAARQTLGNALDLLGLERLDRM